MCPPVVALDTSICRALSIQAEGLRVNIRSKYFPGQLEKCKWYDSLTNQYEKNNKVIIKSLNMLETDLLLFFVDFFKNYEAKYEKTAIGNEWLNRNVPL